MANTPYDPVAFRAQQREQWSNAAQGWRKQWPVFEKGAQPLSDRMLELVRIAPGQRVLDVATGIGEPALTAAQRVGPHGSVVALDQAPHMLDVARERLRATGVLNFALIEADAETVALPPDSFDVIVCRWGMMFFTDPAGTLARLRASLAAGGRLAAAVWGPPEQVPIIGLPFSVLTYGLEQAPPPPRGPNPFALSEPAVLEQVARDAGFQDVRSEPFTVTFEFSSAEGLLEYLTDVSGPVHAYLATQSVERQAEFRGKLATAASAYANANGMIRLPNACLLVAGHR